MLNEGNSYLTNNRTDWECFQLKLDEYIDYELNIYDEDDLEVEALKFTKAIQKAAWESTPQIKRKQIGMNYPREIRHQIAQKRKLRNKWKQTRSPDDKRHLNNASQKLKRALREFKNNSFNMYVSGLSADRNSGYSLWKCTKRLNRPIKHVPPIRRTDGSWARTALDKASVFAEELPE